VAGRGGEGQGALRTSGGLRGGGCRIIARERGMVLRGKLVEIRNSELFVERGGGGGGVEADKVRGGGHPIYKSLV